MTTPDGFLPLTETARAVRELFERAGVEPERPITYWSIRRMALDGVLATQRQGNRSLVPSRDLALIAERFGLKPVAA